MGKSKKMTGGKGWSFEPAGGTTPEAGKTPPASGTRTVKISLEKRPRGKVVTVTAGFILSDAERKSLAASIKRLCGAGGSDSPERIEAQGDHRDAIRDFLSARGWRVR